MRDGRGVGSSPRSARAGVDIASLDAAISMATRHKRGHVAQMGRSGRRTGTSLAALVCSSAPIDQFLAAHPEYLFDASPEHGLVNPDNLFVLLNHLRASTFELPVPAAERFGVEETPMLLDVLQEDGWIRRADDDRYYWSHENFPASDFSLRTGAPENVVIVDTTGDRHRVLGEVDLFAAPLLVHEKAIYIHQGVQHHVDRLDWEERKAYVSQTDVDYYTDADLGITLKVLEVFEEADEPPVGFGSAARVMAWKVTCQELKSKTTRTWLGLDQHQSRKMQRTRVVVPTARWSTDDRATLDGRSSGSRASPARPQRYYSCRTLATRRLARSRPVHRPSDLTLTTRPGGVGLRNASHPRRRALRACREAVDSCGCADGCPACVGPAIEVGPHGKATVGELLAALS